MSEWAVGSSATDAWEHIATATLTAEAASITISGITATQATRLRLYLYVVAAGVTGAITCQFNSDVGSNYQYQDITWNDTVEDAARLTAQSSISFTTDDSQDDGTSALYVASISKPLSSEVAALTIRSSYTDTALNLIGETLAAMWDNTADLITSVTITGAGNLAVGTQLTLEGATT